MTPGSTSSTNISEKLGACTAGTPSSRVPLGSPNQAASARPSKETRECGSGVQSAPPQEVIGPLRRSSSQESTNPKTSARNTAIRPQNPRNRTAAQTRNVAVSSAVHWSTGQYTDATTGARLNPISMTTAPVTAGGSTRCTSRAPARCTNTPIASSTRPETMIAPVTAAESPPAARIAATPPTKAALVPR